jgi:hypothetical protein
VNLISKALNIKPIINIIDSETFDYPEKAPIVDCIIGLLNVVPEGYTGRIINKYL